MHITKLLLMPAMLLSATTANAATTYSFEALSSFGRGPNDTTTYTGGFEFTVANPITINTVIPLVDLTSCTVFASFGNPVCTDQQFLFNQSPGKLTISHSMSNPDDGNDAGGNYYYFDVAAATTNGVWDTVFFGTTQQGRLTVTGAADPIEGVPEPASWATMIAGFGLVGATMRRRRSAAAIA